RAFETTARAVTVIDALQISDLIFKYKHASPNKTVPSLRYSDRPSLQLAADCGLGRPIAGRTIRSHESPVGPNYDLGTGDSDCLAIFRCDRGARIVARDGRATARAASQIDYAIRAGRRSRDCNGRVRCQPRVLDAH